MPQLRTSPPASLPLPQRRGFKAYVLPVERKDWFKVAKALLSLSYWRSQATTEPGYGWYLQRVKALVDEVRLETGADQVSSLQRDEG